MESRLLKPKLVGVSKKYRPTKPNYPELQRSKTLTSMNKNEAKGTGPSNVAKTTQQNHATTARLNQTSKVRAAAQSSDTKEEPKPRPKLNKWDLRGRLAYAEEDLADSKTKLKNQTSKHIQLVEQVSAISEKENFEKERELKARTEFEQLSHEQKELTSEVDKYENSTSEIEKSIGCLKVKLLDTQQELNKCKREHETDVDTLLIIRRNITQIENENDEHIKSITNLKNHNNELQIVLNGLQEKRQKMLAIIQNLQDQN